MQTHPLISNTAIPTCASHLHRRRSHPLRLSRIHMLGHITSMQTYLALPPPASCMNLHIPLALYAAHFSVPSLSRSGFHAQNDRPKQTERARARAVNAA